MNDHAYLDHAAVTVADINWTLAFFKNVLKMSVTRRREADGKLQQVWLDGGIHEVLGAIVATTSMEGIWGNIKTDYMFIAFFSILIFFICVIVSIHNLLVDDIRTL